MTEVTEVFSWQVGWHRESHMISLRCLDCTYSKIRLAG